MAWKLSKTISYKMEQKEGVPSYEVTPYITYGIFKAKSGLSQNVPVDSSTDLIQAKSDDMILKLQRRKDLDFGDVAVMFSRLYFRTREAAENMDMFLRDKLHRPEENQERYDRLLENCELMQDLIGKIYGKQTRCNLEKSADAFYETTLRNVRPRFTNKPVKPRL